MRKAKQAFDTNKVEKKDNAQTLASQRKDARLEIGRVITWAAQYKYVYSDELIAKLNYIQTKTLREDI